MSAPRAHVRVVAVKIGNYFSLRGMRFLEEEFAIGTTRSNGMSIWKKVLGKGVLRIMLWVGLRMDSISETVI